MNHRLSNLDPGEKPTDIGDERRRRHDALILLREALDREARVTERLAAEVEAAASTAMWLGASLADLAAVTGKTRQAARKRWPTLGIVHRRRVWLANHVDDVRWAVHVVLENEANIVVDDRTMFDELRALDARVATDFDESAEQGAAAAAERWHILDRLVDVVLRTLVDRAETADSQAEFAVFGAKGVVGYYDHASNKREADPELA